MAAFRRADQLDFRRETSYQSDAVLELRYITIHPAPKFRDGIGLRDRSQPLIAAKRKIPTRHAEA